MIYFISDIHLGSLALPDREAHQARFVEFLQSLEDATALYILGDMFDFWHEYLYDTRLSLERSRLGHFAFFRPTLEALRALVQRGVEVHWFVGNHDMWTYGWLSRETGVTLHGGPETLEVGGKKMFFAHGDGLVPSDFWTRIPKEYRGKIKRFILLRKLLFQNPLTRALMRVLPPALGDKWGYAWARHSRLKELSHPCAYKGEDREELVLYAKEQEQKGVHHDFYVFGHRHVELDLLLASRARVVILGDFFRQFTYAKMDDKQFELCIQEKNS